MRRRILLAGLASLPAFGQAGLGLPGGGPVEITAVDGIEWRRNEDMVIARGQAQARRERFTLNADRLIGRFRPRSGAARPAAGPTEGGSEIYRLEALGDVRITNGTDQAFADRAVYDLDQAVVVLTGRSLRLVSSDAQVTARDALEYWPVRRLAVARGNALVRFEREQRSLAADVLSAFLRNDGQPAPTETGRGNIERLEAFGNVRIETAAEVVQGDVGAYTATDEIARLGGNVRITRGPNQLVGREAEVNMRTGVSRLLAGRDGRVQGLIFPDSQPPAPATPGQGPAPRR